jgi:hypothetical protein
MQTIQAVLGTAIVLLVLLSLLLGLLGLVGLELRWVIRTWCGGAADDRRP